MNAKFGFLLGFILLFFVETHAQFAGEKGFVKESLSVKSVILGHDIKYSVYLPYDYFTSSRSYPVLYLLHGYSDNETSWIQFGEVNAIADKLIAAQLSAPMVIVMPDAGLTWYINNFDGSVRYEDAFFKEFIPAIEKTYRIRTNKQFRTIGGLSMGGYGALLYTFKHPEMFAASMPFSADIRDDSQMLKLLRIGESNSNQCYGMLKGDTLPPTWRVNDVLSLAEKLPLDQLNSVKFYIDCADKDNLLFGNFLLHFIFKARGVAHEFRVRGGDHSWSYWRQSIDDGLRFLSPVVHR